MPAADPPGNALGQKIEDDFDKQARERGMTDAERLDAFNANMMTTGWLGYGPMQFAKENGGGRWLLTEYEAGDVVFHKPHMVRTHLGLVLGALLTY